MRKNLMIVLGGVLLASAGSMSAFAVSPEDAVIQVRNQLSEDMNVVEGFTCGGLMSSGDMRMHAYYNRVPDPLDCTLMTTCTDYDPVSGKCVGDRCDLVINDLAPSSTKYSHCDASGTCVTPKPHRECSLFNDSAVRMWDCGQQESVQCFRYEPVMRYPQSYYPLAYNCIATFDTSPLRSDEPQGQLSLVAPQDLVPEPRAANARWEPVPRSTLSLPTDAVLQRADDSLQGLTVDTVRLSASPNVVQDGASSPLFTNDYPGLVETIGRLLHPPQIRLVLPRDVPGFDRSGNIFDRLHEALRPHDEKKKFSDIVLGAEPDALLEAANLLRSTPLFEVQFEPLKVQAPFASRVQLQHTADAWEVWLERVQLIIDAQQADPIDSALRDRIENNIRSLRSYIAVQDSIQDYRRQFPVFVKQLLSTVHETNVFYRDSWLAENASRLEEWHAAYTDYLPQLRTELQALHAESQQLTSSCLVSACRMDAVPVKEGTLPWHVIEEGNEFVLHGDDAAWLPTGFPLWEPQETDAGLTERGYRDRWHTLRGLLMPLPDLTFDISQVLQQSVIRVPVIQVEAVPLLVPEPPSVGPSDLENVLGDLERSLITLPRITPPLLSFPPFTLPDPETSLLLIPEPPIALATWKDALAVQRRKLALLSQSCDTSSTPKTFLISEHQLYSGGYPDRSVALSGWKKEGTQSIRTISYNPAALRAVSFGNWRWWNSLFAMPSLSIPYQQSNQQMLSEPQDCPTCGTVRPQRYIRQHLALNPTSAEWDALLKTFRTSIDEFNAQIRFISVLSHQEQELLEDPQWIEYPTPLSDSPVR